MPELLSKLTETLSDDIMIDVLGTTRASRTTISASKRTTVTFEKESGAYP